MIRRPRRRVRVTTDRVVDCDVAECPDRQPPTRRDPIPSGDLGRRAWGWVVDRWQLLAAAAGGLVAAAAFVAGVTSDAGAGAALVPRVMAVETRLDRIEAVLPTMATDIRDIRVFLLGARTPPPPVLGAP